MAADGITLCRDRTHTHTALPVPGRSMEPISHARWAEGSLSVYDTQLRDVFETALTTGKPCSNRGEGHDRHVFSPLMLLKHPSS